MNLKEQLHSYCRGYLQANMEQAEAAITSLREAMQNETKSSMGDKYETTREMLQQDINMNGERLAKTKAELAILATINPDIHTPTVVPGSLVITSQGNFFIAVSAGNTIMEDRKYYLISASSPIAIIMKGKTKGDSFIMNGKKFQVQEVL